MRLIASSLVRIAFTWVLAVPSVMRQPARDVLVAPALGHQLQHVELALREAGLGHALQRLAATEEEV